MDGDCGFQVQHVAEHDSGYGLCVGTFCGLPDSLLPHMGGQNWNLTRGGPSRSQGLRPHAPVSEQHCPCTHRKDVSVPKLPAQHVFELLSGRPHALEGGPRPASSYHPIPANSHAPTSSGGIDFLILNALSSVHLLMISTGSFSTPSVSLIQTMSTPTLLPWQTAHLPFPSSAGLCPRVDLFSLESALHASKGAVCP